MQKIHLIRKFVPSTLLAAANVLFIAIPVTAADYPAAVLADGPQAYYRLGDTNAPLPAARNAGSLGAAGAGSHFNVLHGDRGAIVGSANGSTFYTEYPGQGGARTTVPFTSAINPPAGQPFTIEAWVKPTIEGLGNAQAPLFNRHSVSPRQGWVFFQRSSGTGFNFRMYNGIDGNQSVDITGGPYTIGDWTHLAATWDGTTARLFVNGAEVASGANTYAANTDTVLSVGAYGANNPGDNPYTGYVDEVAWYSNALSSSQILAHYDNATNSSRTVAYENVVKTDGAVLYLRLNEPNAINSGSLGAAADGTHTVGVKLGSAGAIVGSTDTAATYVGIADADGGSPTTIPFNSALNPASSFTVEYWVKPTVNGFGNAQCPLHNRASTQPNGNGNRTGWDFFQRDQGTGWNWRLFNGNGGTRVFNLTGGPYTVGQWHHLVAVYDSTVPSATLYQNGVVVASSSTPTEIYAPKTNGDLAIGSYSNPALNDGGYENAFTGSIDEVAIYGSALSGPQVLAHYQNGTNAARGTPYETLIASASPLGYWRMNEAPNNVIANSGSLGSVAAGVSANARTNSGPSAPTFLGFEPDNRGRAFDGSSSYIEMGNPAGINLSGQGSIEAWVQPAAIANFESYILGHGGNDTFASEDALRIENSIYQIVSYDGLNHKAEFDATPDLGSGSWVHLVGTYNGVDWKLYRNGIPVSTNSDAIGFLPVNNANWSIGARGRWHKAFGIQAGAAFPDRAFPGGIDEVAVYSYALSDARIAAHYSVGVLGSNPLSIVKSGSDVVITWPAGTLQEANEAAGTYSDVVATSPLTTPASGTRKFYRIKL